MISQYLTPQKIVKVNAQLLQHATNKKVMTLQIAVFTRSRFYNIRYYRSGLSQHPGILLQVGTKCVLYNTTFNCVIGLVYNWIECFGGLYYRYLYSDTRLRWFNIICILSCSPICRKNHGVM